MLSEIQGIILIFFYIGGIISYGTGAVAGGDLWLATILAIMATLPLLMICARILSIFPQQDFFEILSLLFGKWFGKLLGLIFVWVALNLAAINLWDEGAYIVTNAMAETPRNAFVFVVIILAIWLVKSGIENFSSWAELFCIVTVPIVITVILLITPQMELANLQPVLANGYQPVIKGAFFLFSSHFGEVVVLLMLLSGLKNPQSYYKVFLIGFLLGGVWLLTTFSSEMMILGSDLYGISYFPIYAAVAKLNIESFKRTEQVVLILNVAYNFVKMALDLLIAACGISKIFGFKDYRFLTMPIGLLIFNLSNVLFTNIMERKIFQTEVFVYTKLIFILILPLLIWLVAEMRKDSLVKNK